MIRQAGAYRWVGIYEVFEREIAALGWTGSSAPAHPRFPRSQGLCGAAVARAVTVIANDVSRDRRYLTTFADTGSEIVVPVVSGSAGRVVGLIDVESERVRAFGEADKELLEACAPLLLPLWEPQGAPAT